MSNKNENWKQVTLGGSTGILMGAGALYAGERYVGIPSEEVAEAGVQLATPTSHGLSFREAFDAARAEQGPGGVFSWHGRLFNTYTADEWNAMSDEERENFSAQFKPEVSADEVDTNKLAQLESETNSDMETDESLEENVTTRDEEDEDIVVVATAEDETDAGKQTEEENETMGNDDDNDVRVIGFGDVTLNDGSTVTVEEVDINGQRVAVIDVDQDGVADLAISDLDGNNYIDDDEILNLHTRETLASGTYDESDMMASTDVDDIMMPA